MLSVLLYVKLNRASFNISGSSVMVFDGIATSVDDNFIDKY